MNIWDIIILLAIAALIGTAVFLTVKTRKNGGCGSASCSSCSSCSSCPSCGACGKNAAPGGDAAPGGGSGRSE